MSRRTRGLCRRTPTVTAWHGGSAERSTSSRVRIVAELATTHHAVPAPRKRTTKSRCSRERAADGPEAGQLSSEGRSAWTRRILEAAAVIRSVHTADRADVVGQQQAWSNPERVRRLSLRNIEPDTFSLVFCTPYRLVCGAAGKRKPENGTGEELESAAWCEAWWKQSSSGMFTQRFTYVRSGMCGAMPAGG